MDSETECWERKIARLHWCRQTVRTRSKATWRLSLAGEFATLGGMLSASALINLTKASVWAHPVFSLVGRWFWNTASRGASYVSWLEVHGRRRFLLVESVATKVVCSGCAAVVARCVHATTFMKVALVDFVDHTLKNLPSLFAAVVVDGTQLQMKGRAHQVAQFIKQANGKPQ